MPRTNEQLDREVRRLTNSTQRRIPFTDLPLPREGAAEGDIWFSHPRGSPLKLSVRERGGIRHFWSGEPLFVDGSNQANSSFVNYTGTPADNQIAVFTDVNTLEGSSKFTYDGDTLSILGVATSAAKDVIKIGVDGEYAVSMKFFDDDAEAAQHFKLTWDAVSRDFKFHSADADNIIYIETEGNVGLSVTAPGARVHAQGAANSITSIFQAHATGTANITEWHDSADNILASVDSGGNIYGQNIQVPDGGTVGYSGGPIWTFDNTNGDISTLYPVGIGTAAPDQLLHLYKAASAIICKIQVDSGQQGYLDFYEATTLRARLNMSGADNKFYIDAAAGLILQNTAGSVGVNTAIPATTFQNVGTTRLGDQATNYMAVSATGGVTWVGASGLVFGSCYGNHIGWSQAGAVQNTWYNISDADMLDGVLHLVTHDGSGKLTVTEPGMYRITWTVCLEVDAANDHIEVGVEISGSGSANAAGQAHVENKFANEEEHVGGTCILDLADNATIEAAIRTTDAGTPTISAQAVNITCVQVGGT